MISEGNFYRLVCGSTLPDAQPFEQFVFDEVLPTIRKTGKFDIAEHVGAKEDAVTAPKDLTLIEMLESAAKALREKDIVIQEKEQKVLQLSETNEAFSAPLSVSPLVRLIVLF